MDRVVLSLAQLNVLTDKLVKSGYQRIVIEDTNMENTLACQLDGKAFLVNEKGAVYRLWMEGIK